MRPSRPNHAPSNSLDLSAERGNASLDRRHNLVSSFTYELPVGRGRAYGRDWNRGLDAVLGGWQLGGILTLRTECQFEDSSHGYHYRCR